MPVKKVIFKDENGFHYRFPERSCDRCLKYPCVDDMQILKGNFAKYGCENWVDSNIFNICKH